MVKKRSLLKSEITRDEEDIEEVCFEDYTGLPEGAVSLFGNTNEKPIEPTTIVNEPIYDNRKNPIANGATPAIEGEIPNCRRTYVLRESTIRKLNELKAAHQDINAYVSTIVDAAISNYHKHVLEDGNPQK